MKSPSLLSALQAAPEGIASDRIASDGISADASISDVHELEMARVADARLRRLLASDPSPQTGASLELRFRGDDGESREVVPLPASALRLLEAILEAGARGEALTVVPTQSEFTPNQAVQMLGVSRPFLT